MTTYLSASLSMLPVSEDGMTKEHVEAMFLLAGIPVVEMESMPNQYYTGYADPWWTVTTPKGKIIIGWRKRVLSISWTDTNCAVRVTKDSVTIDDHMVHAWSYAKAVEYLTELRRELQRPPKVGSTANA